MAALDSMEFRRALGCFMTGVTVVMTRDGDGLPRGFTANSFSSVSLDPPLVSVCIDRGIASYRVFKRCSGFSVNILAETQRDVSNLFASARRDKFDNVAWRNSKTTGAPCLADSVAWFDCVPYRRLDAGDHLILIGEVKDFRHSDRSPLSFCRGNYVSFDLMPHILSQRSGQQLRVGCIADLEGAILLVRRGGHWTLPSSDHMGTRDGELGLHGVLKTLGVTASLDFLFAVFDGPGDGELSIFYRGEIDSAERPPHDPAELFPYEQIPWDELPSEAHRSMLRRYLDERRRFQFGIYVGSSEAGAVIKVPES